MTHTSDFVDARVLAALQVVTVRDNETLRRTEDGRYFTSRVADAANMACSSVLRALRCLEQRGKVRQADRVSGQPRWSLA